MASLLRSSECCQGLMVVRRTKGVAMRRGQSEDGLNTRVTYAQGPCTTRPTSASYLSSRTDPFFLFPSCAAMLSHGSSSGQVCSTGRPGSRFSSTGAA